eukprot:g3535.t1
MATTTGLLTQQQLLNRLNGIQANVTKAKDAVAALDFKEAIAEVHQLAVWSGHLMDDMAVVRDSLEEAAKDKDKAEGASSSNDELARAVFDPAFRKDGSGATGVKQDKPFSTMRPGAREAAAGVPGTAASAAAQESRSRRQVINYFDSDSEDVRPFARKRAASTPPAIAKAPKFASSLSNAVASKVAFAEDSVAAASRKTTLRAGADFYDDLFSTAPAASLASRSGVEPSGKGAQERQQSDSSSSDSDVELVCRAMQTTMSGNFRLGAFLRSSGNEHRCISLVEGKPELDLIKVCANIVNFKKKAAPRSAAELAGEAKPTEITIKNFPELLLMILKADGDDERKGIAVLSQCVMLAKAILLQSAAQASSPVAAESSLIPSGLLGQDQWVISASGSSSPTGSAPSPIGSAGSGADPSTWGEAAPDTQLPASISSALGPQLLQQVEEVRKSMIRSSVKPSTEKAYMSTLGRALAMAAIPWSALPVRDVGAYGLLIARLYGVAKTSDSHTVKDAHGIARVKWSLFASFEAALRFYHESRIEASDFGELAGAPEIIRMYTSIKKDSRREVENPKEKTTFEQLIEVNKSLVDKRHKVWKDNEQGELVFGGEGKLNADTGYNQHMQCCQAVGVIRGKTEFSRGDLACGRKAVVPHVPMLQPSPVQLLRAIKITKQILREKWLFKDPPPRVGPDAKKEFQAQHGSNFGSVGAPALQQQKFVLCSFDHINKRLNLWNGPALSHTLKTIFTSGNLSFVVKNPTRVSLRASGALLFSRTSRQAAIMNAGWTSSLMSYTTYAQLSPEQLVHASKRCLILEARAAVIGKAAALAQQVASKPRSACLALYKCDARMRVCSFLAEVVETWHLLGFKVRKQIVSVKWGAVLKVANEGHPRMLVSSDLAKKSLETIMGDLKNAL